MKAPLKVLVVDIGGARVKIPAAGRYRRCTMPFVDANAFRGGSGLWEGGKK